MAFDQSTRNRLQKFVSNARTILGEEFTRQLQATYGLDPKQGTVATIDSLTHLDNRQRQTAHLLRETLAHYLATTPGKGEKDRTKQVLDRIVREQAFTVLNRLAALRMAEARGFLLESIAKAHSSKGFQLYRQLSGTAHGETGDAYRNYLFSLFHEFSLDLAVLFDRHSAQGLLFPRESALLELLAEINHVDIEHLWAEDETIGWIYQYFNSQEERKKMRAESQAPRNSRELAVRNQFFTPRYVVEFLTDNTLGRIWYEMTQGNTALVDSCRYLVRRPTEIFLKSGETAPETEQTDSEALSQEELLKQPVYIPHRPLKDPRSIRMLDPACGSMHFGLYAFDLFERIYLEAWQLEQQLGPDAFTREAGQQALQSTYESLEAFKQLIPKLIIEHNIHGVDIDPRAVQIAGLSLWQRAQRAWHQQGIKPQQRPTIVKSNIVCAEPMPGEKALLQEFTSKLNPPVLGQLLEVIFDKMELAGEAGTLLKIEEEIQTAIHEARKQWLKQSGSNSVGDLFQAELEAATPQAKLGFDLRGIDDETFWDDAEQRILQALSDYADQAESNADQKRLFAEDAAKGFAFIDLCRKRFDVVLMNPPFGLCSTISKKYIEKHFNHSKVDIYSCFIFRALEILAGRGKVGAITSRSGLFLQNFSDWRELVFFKDGELDTLIDLGSDVLDNAMVETAAYVINQNNTGSPGYCIRLVESKSKESDLLNILDGTYSPESIYVSNQSLLKKIPNFPIAYWVNEELGKAFTKYRKLKDFSRIQRGLFTADDFRFVRLFWECQKSQIALNGWGVFAKGGSNISYIYDPVTVVKAHNQFKELKAYIVEKYSYLNGNYNFVLHMENDYGKEGLTFTLRTSSRFSVRLLKSGCYFANKGPAIFPSAQLISGWGLLNTQPVMSFIDLFMGRADGGARQYDVKILNELPWPEIPPGILEKISELTGQCVRVSTEIYSNYIENSLFNGFDKEKIELIASGEFENYAKKLNESILNSHRELEEISAKIFNVEAFDWRNIDLGHVPQLKLRTSEISYRLVCWIMEESFSDESVLSGDRISNKFESIFLELSNENSLEKINRNMSVATTHDLFCSRNELFDFILKIYSASRRQAPIFWPLQIPSGSYTLWVYYHRLNEQTLYTCVNDFVEPKLQQVEQDLNGLRSKSARSSQEEKELEKLSDLASELRDFRDELLRLAKFWKPNLNDGVQITAAPLWKLFQHRAWQNKLKGTWEKLEQGEYDWAHLACSIWPERVLRKCHQDRSLAIAHDVEDHFWHEVEVPVKRGKKLTGSTKLDWQPKDINETEILALIKQIREERGL